MLTLCQIHFAKGIMAENGRLRHVKIIAKNFTDLTMAHQGEVKATVTTVIVSDTPISFYYYEFILLEKFKLCYADIMIHQSVAFLV